MLARWRLSHFQALQLYSKKEEEENSSLGRLTQHMSIFDGPELWLMATLTQGILGNQDFLG